MAAVLNFIGALAGTAVAEMVGAELVESVSITQVTILSAHASAII